MKRAGDGKRSLRRPPHQFTTLLSRTSYAPGAGQRESDDPRPASGGPAALLPGRPAPLEHFADTRARRTAAHLPSGPEGAIAGACGRG